MNSTLQVAIFDRKMFYYKGVISTTYMQGETNKDELPEPTPSSADASWVLERPPSPATFSNGFLVFFEGEGL